MARQRLILGIIALSAVACGRLSTKPEPIDGGGADDGPARDGTERADGTVARDASPGDAVETIAARAVGPAGGSIEAAGGVRIDIPQGALTATVTITIGLSSNPPSGPAGSVYEIGPDGTELAKPVVLTLPYNPGTLGSTTAASHLALAHRGEAGWAGQGWALIDASRRLVSGYITHFSQWAVWPVPPNQGCSVNYGCLERCSGSQPPDVCCSANRNACKSVLRSSFPSYVACYAACIGKPILTNFGNSTCLDSCCTHQGWTVIRGGACYSANATLGDAEAVVDCGRTCFSSTDNLFMCDLGTIFTPCLWNADIRPELGDECVGRGMGVNSQFLYTQLHTIDDQIWGHVIEVTGGSISSTALEANTKCQNGMPFGGSIHATWVGDRFEGTWTFGSSSGNITISPHW